MTGSYYTNAQESLNKINGKWKGLILITLLKKDYRFNKIKQILEKISSKVLVDNLEQLEVDGLIKKKDRVYSLTTSGHKIAELTISILDNLKIYLLILLCLDQYVIVLVYFLSIV